MRLLLVSSLRIRKRIAINSVYSGQRSIVARERISYSHHKTCGRSFSTRSASSSNVNDSIPMREDVKTKNSRRVLPDDGVTLSYFIQNNNENSVSPEEDNDKIGSTIPTSAPLDLFSSQEKGEKGLQQPIIKQELKFHLKTYGCQMNVSDSDIVRSILLSYDEKIKFEETHDEMDADVLLTNTCAIRENAESKVWHRLKELRVHDSKNPLIKNSTMPSSNRKKKKHKRIIGVLGCMAERLKEDMFKEGTADLIVGPDAYRDLPRLISALAPSSQSENQMERALNVELSIDETYADIKPVRSNEDDVSAFVSVMRGCNNMCSYCVVPFTRGRERSRELESIVKEARVLFEENGVKEICLLGQNVNSYHDKSENAILARPLILDGEPEIKTKYKTGYNTSNEGFNNMFKLRGGAGYYFVDLVEAVSDISPELRVRFTSPHPKDYPPELLSLMAERHNVCNHLHMPAQSGSTEVLKRMRRGYSREAYLELIEYVYQKIPDVAISSDFITGFCGETEEEHKDTLSLMEYVKYDQAFMFAYSMRGKTHASRNMTDDIPELIKSRRLQEVIQVFRDNVQTKNEENEIGKLRLVLVEGESRKSKEGHRSWGGRTDQNKRIVFPTSNKQNPKIWSEDAVKPILSALSSSSTSLGGGGTNHLLYSFVQNPKVELRRGDYAVVLVEEARGHTLRGKLLWKATMKGFQEMGLGNYGDGKNNNILSVFNAMAYS